MTQLEQILGHFRTNDPVTGQYLSLSPMEALGLYRIQRLAARVQELKRLGFDVRSHLKKDRTGKRYARYSINWPAPVSRRVTA